MSPPHVPGIPGIQLPETSEQKRLTALENRLTELEAQVAGAREKLDTLEDLEEEITQNGRIPSDAPKLAKSGLAALHGIPPNQRAAVLIVAIVVAAIVITILALHGFKVI